MRARGSGEARDPFHRIPILALSILLIYLLWGQLLPLLACGALLFLALKEVNSLATDVHRDSEDIPLLEKKVRDMEKQLASIEEEHRVTLIRMKQQQNQVLMQMQQIESRISS